VFLLNRPSTFAPATPTSIILRTEAAEPVTLPTSRPTFTAEPEPAVAPGFKDDFEQQLAEGWTWLAEDPARWSISETPGWLQILASDASFDGPSFPTNVLVREPPAGDFEAITLVRFDPASNFQFAGLVVFQDKGNVLQFVHGFCDLPETCVGKGIYFDNFEGGYIVANHKVAISNSEIYLRIRRVGNTYIGSYSEDGENWITVGEHAREFSKVQIGLLADQSSTAIPALFDFFHLISQTQ
jgi:beta-xylosidase